MRNNQPIYIAASAEAFVIRTQARTDDNGDETGEFDAEAVRCPIVGWHLEPLVSAGDFLASPIIPGQRALQCADVLCIMGDGTLWDIENGQSYASVEDARTRAALGEHKRWISHRARAGQFVRIDGGRA